MLQIVLIGNWKKKEKFINYCYMDDFFDFHPNLDSLEHGDFKIWHLKDKEHFIFEDNGPIEQCIKNADAFIYIDADLKLKDSFEKKRNKDNCIVIDYELLQLDPLDCLGKVTSLMIREKAMQKSMLVLGANSKDNPECLLHNTYLPIELAGGIANLLYSIVYKNGFFSSQQEILNREPQSLQQENKTEENYRV
jgi:hypothetical protein